MEKEPRKAKAEAPKRYRTRTGFPEHIPGLGFVVTDKLLEKPHAIQAIENFQARSGKQVMGVVVILS